MATEEQLTKLTEAAELLPKPPKFDLKQLQEWKESKNYHPILFEWYKFVGSLTIFIAHIMRESPAFRDLSPRLYYVLVGLLNRCGRLMLSNVALSYEGRFGETTAIVDRCIFESATKIVWICEGGANERADRYIADGLKSELEFQSIIEAKY